MSKFLLELAKVSRTWYYIYYSKTVKFVVAYSIFLTVISSWKKTKPWPHHFHIIAVHVTRGIFNLPEMLQHYIVHPKSYWNPYDTGNQPMFGKHPISIPGHWFIAYQSCMPRHANKCTCVFIPEWSTDCKWICLCMENLLIRRKCVHVLKQKKTV